MTISKKIKKQPHERRRHPEHLLRPPRLKGIVQLTELKPEKKPKRKKKEGEKGKEGEK